MINILFIGAHPDDLEIGAGGTINKWANDKNINITLCILTTEESHDQSLIRQQEQSKSAIILGLNPETQLLCFNIPDGKVEVNNTNITNLRNFLERNRLLHPDIVVTHSKLGTDDHSDHFQARRLIDSVFRDTIKLGFFIPLSGTADFQPEFYVDISKNKETKQKALHEHISQLAKGRIREDDIELIEKNYGQLIGVDYAEGFDVQISERGYKKSNILYYLNNSPFIQFWYPFINNRCLYVILPSHHKKRSQLYKISQFTIRLYSELFDFFISFLNHRFSTPFSKKQGVIKVIENDLSESRNIYHDGDVLLIGGPYTNNITQQLFNNEEGLRYVIDFDKINNKLSGFIYDKFTNHKEFYPKYKNNKLIEDYGIITILIRQNSKYNNILIGCMGIHSLATSACLRILYNPSQLQKLIKIDIIQNLLRHEKFRGCQIVVCANINEIHFLDKLHIIQ